MQIDKYKRELEPGLPVYFLSKYHLRPEETEINKGFVSETTHNPGSSLKTNIDLGTEDITTIQVHFLHIFTASDIINILDHHVAIDTMTHEATVDRLIGHPLGRPSMATVLKKAYLSRISDITRSVK